MNRMRQSETDPLSRMIASPLRCASPERYDDGGFSGSNLNRPALELLVSDIREGAVECVVVYKVDRLS